MASGVVFTADKRDMGHEDKASPWRFGRGNQGYGLRAHWPADVLQLYVRDGKPVDVSRATLKITLLHQVATSKEIDLKPSGDKLDKRAGFKSQHPVKGCRARWNQYPKPSRRQRDLF